MCASADFGCPATGSCVLTGQYEVGEACNPDFGDQRVELRGTIKAALPGGSFSISGSDLVLDGGKLKSPGGLQQLGGDISLFLRGDFSMGGNNSRIDTSANAGGGSVVIEAASVTIEAGAGIVTDGGAGDNCGGAGPVSISAHSGAILLTGSGVAVQAKSAGYDCDGGFVELDAESLRLEKGIDASGGAPPGINLLATSGDIHVESGAVLDARARGSDEDFGNDGGEVDLETRAGDIFLRARIFVEGSGADGGGGEVSFDSSGDVLIAADIRAGSAGAFALGGTFQVRAEGDLILEESVDGSGGAQGDGGQIDISVSGGVSLSPGKSISVSGGEYGGGFLDIRAGTRLLLDGDLLARGSRGGDGGFIDLQACEFVANGAIDVGAAGRGLGGVLDIEAAVITLGAAAQIDAQPCPGADCVVLLMPSGAPTIADTADLATSWELNLDPTRVPCCGNGVIEDGTGGTVDAGENCDDGNARHCDGCSPSCILESVPACPPDSNECTRDCSPDSGCAYEPLSSIPCLDEPGGNVCTTDVCELGVCVHREIACDDGIACTVDRCDATLGCQADPSDPLCHDGESCTISKCDPQVGEPVTGCAKTSLPDGIPCEDGDYCTTGEACASGVCVATGPSLACDDGDSCTFDDCEPAIGCVNSENPRACGCVDSNGIPKPAGAACVDGNGCTRGDSCDDAGQCLPGPSCPDDGDPCTRDSCAFGICFHTDTLCPVEGSCIDGEACSDADACTRGICRDGACEATLRACSDGDDCTGIESCSPALGCRQVSQPPAGGVCQDASLPAFLCYRARRPVGGLEVASLGSLLVRDEFGLQRVDLRRRVAVCLPVSLQGQAPAGASWLQAHRWKRSSGQAPFRFRPNVDVENVFGSTRVDIKKPDLGLVPSATSLDAGALAWSSPAPSNFSCYRVGLSRDVPRSLVAEDLWVQDALGAHRLDVRSPTRACSPADINGLTPQSPSHPDRLLCYRVRPVEGVSAVGAAPIATLDFLGAGNAIITRPVELCVPSWFGSLVP